MSRTEIIDVYSEDGQVMQTLPREEAEQAYHVTSNALIFIFDGAGRVWSQLRPANKTHFPGLWDITACGGLLSSETALAAAERELEEETGLKAQLHHVESFLNVFEGAEGRDHRRLSHLYFGITDEIPQTGIEADEFRAWEPGELQAELKARPQDFVPPFAAELEKGLAAYREYIRGQRQTK